MKRMFVCYFLYVKDMFTKQEYYYYFKNIIFQAL